MSNNSVTPNDDVNSVETAVENLLTSSLPIKSLTIIHNVIAGVILGEVDEIDHEMDLAAGVSYLVIGLGKLPTSHQRGIELIEIKKEQSK